jgi:hypothetical protein
MPVDIIATQPEITSAINAFSSHYHLAFKRTIALARRYLHAGAPVQALVAPLASRLRATLVAYGAGTRGAPACHSMAAIETALVDPILFTALQAFAKSARSLRMSGPCRSIAPRTVAQGTGIAQAESQMLTALTLLSAGLFIGCTNVTYPMKALMLLTGAIPAFDSQVKEGLTLGGFPGFASTRYLLNTPSTSAARMKLTRLPFLLGDCYWRHRALLSSAAAQSLQPHIFRYPGRLFDVLLFVQGRNGHPVIVQLLGGAPNWHQLQ